MCGIIGQLSTKSQFGQSEILKISNLLDHRGPDSFGMYKSPCHRVTFFHRRLAILDLSEFGAQPMSSQCGMYHIVFNGEIYNHNELRKELVQLGLAFKSNSDTEVLLAGYTVWKEGLLSRLNGPFAFAIHDQKNNTVFMARDRIGEKPLFYADINNTFVFASEQKPILALLNQTPRFNGFTLISYLCRGYPIDSGSLLVGVNILKPGHCIKYNLETGSKDIYSYWSPEFRGIHAPANLADLILDLQNLFSDAVKLQLHCDVPTCVLLSGGVDSSLITAFASQHTSTVKTFTVKFPGYPNFDETERARLIARFYSTDHTEIDGVLISPDLIELIAASLDTPINDSSLIPTYLVYSNVAKICKVALGGDGADELFGGYKHYSRLLLLDKYIGSALPLLPHTFAQFLKRNIPSRYRARNWIVALSSNLNVSCPNIREILDLAEARKILGIHDSSCSDESFYREWANISAGSGSVLQNAICADLKGYFPSSILVKTDRTSMLNSIESRAPFLDTRIIDFALNRVPDSFKATPSNRKILLKELGRRVLPTDFDFKRKLGFNLPLGELIRYGTWRSYFSDVLHSQYSFLNRDQCIRLFRNHLNGSDHSDKLFGLVLLIRWAQVNGVQSVEF